MNKAMANVRIRLCRGKRNTALLRSHNQVGLHHDTQLPDMIQVREHICHFSPSASWPRACSSNLLARKLRDRSLLHNHKKGDVNENSLKPDYKIMFLFKITERGGGLPNIWLHNRWTQPATRIYKMQLDGCWLFCYSKRRGQYYRENNVNFSSVVITNMITRQANLRKNILTIFFK